MQITRRAAFAAPLALTPAAVIAQPASEIASLYADIMRRRDEINAVGQIPDAVLDPLVDDLTAAERRFLEIEPRTEREALMQFVVASDEWTAPDSLHQRAKRLLA